MKNIKIGLLGVGLDTYWNQFDGLLDKLTNYRNTIKSKIQAVENVSVVDAGMVDNQDKAHQTRSLMKAEDVELLFVFISTYALSSTVLTAVRGLNIPIILLNIQPTQSIDYDKINSLPDRKAMTGEWLANCQACSVPEFASVFNRGSIKYEIVSGYLDDPEAWNDIYSWIDAAKLSYGMRHNRMGILGNYYGGMVDVYTDLALQTLVFGTHIEVVEMCELSTLRKGVTDAEIKNKIKEFYETFIIDTACSKQEIERAACTSVALDKLVKQKKLGSMTYYYEGSSGNQYEDIVTSLIAGNTLLTAKNIPIVGESEVKTAQAMKMMALLGVGGCFSEFYAMDFKDDIVMLGHDGPSHTIISEEKVKLVPLQVYHGKPGKGLSIQMSVKHGPVTLLSVVEGKEGLSLLVAEGESVPGAILEIGNLNSRYKFPISVKEFIERWSKAGPSHHCSIGVGHISDVLKKYAFILDIPITIIS